MNMRGSRKDSHPLRQSQTADVLGFTSLPGDEFSPPSCGFCSTHSRGWDLLGPSLITLVAFPRDIWPSSASHGTRPVSPEIMRLTPAVFDWITVQALSRAVQVPGVGGALVRDALTASNALASPPSSSSSGAERIRLRSRGVKLGERALRCQSHSPHRRQLPRRFMRADDHRHFRRSFVRAKSQFDSARSAKGTA